MADDAKPKAGGGCLSKLVFLILFTGTLGLGVAMFFAAQPQELDDLRAATAADDVPQRDLKLVLSNAIDRGYPVTLAEAELNSWLGRVLETKQGGLLADHVELDRVWLRLQDGVAEVVMERNVQGHPFTVSMFLTIEQVEEAGKVRTNVHLHGGTFAESMQRPFRGGRFGKLVVPQGFLILVKPAYEKLAKCLAEEIHLAFEEMSRVEIRKGKLELDPRSPNENMSGSLLPGSF